MTAFLQFDRVSYRVEGRQILRDVSFELAENETLVLLGRSGSGKTTLLRMANRLVVPTSGTIRFEGRDIAQWDPIALRRRIGYVIQDGGLFPHRTVAQNVAVVPELERWPPQKVSDRVEELLTAVGLATETYAARYPRQLSGGEKQRVGIARALAADPPLLLLDEPFAALDPVTRFDMQLHFQNLREQFGKAALFVTHDLREALLLGSRIALLHDGAIETIGSPTQFLAATTVEARTFLRTLQSGVPA
ncbi:MAG: ATP-binding cassette domain-containing protein [Rudaea sp.]